MEKLFQMKIIFGVAFLVLVVRETAMAQDRCSLVVRVVDSDNKEVPGAHIKVTERNGRVVEATNRRGGTRFCDLGILPVTITVGSKACNEVTVRNAPLDWG